LAAASGLPLNPEGIKSFSAGLVAPAAYPGNLSPNIREFLGRAGAALDAIGFRGEEPMLVF
jgi:hypothetical protein